MNTGTINIAGFELQYIIEGRGIPILVVGSAVYYHRTFSPEIKKRYQFIFIDHRGFVPPPADDMDNKTFELDVLIEDLETARKFFDLKSFIMLGHSGHAFMALEYAKKYPDHVLGIVMIAVTPDYSEKTHQAADLFFELHASAERKKIFAENMSELPGIIAAEPQKRFVSYCLAAGPKSWFDYTFDASSLWTGVYTNMQMIDYVWGIVFRDIDITKGLEQLNKPVFLALGKYDFLTGPTDLWNDIQKHFRNITIEIFEKSSHCPQYEEAEQFNRALMEWINCIDTKQVSHLLSE